jgi:hypothetical protein
MKARLTGEEFGGLFRLVFAGVNSEGTLRGGGFLYRVESRPVVCFEWVTANPVCERVPDRSPDILTVPTRMGIGLWADGMTAG